MTFCVKHVTNPKLTQCHFHDTMLEKGGIRMLTNNQINDLRKGFISDFNADLNGVRETIAKS